MNMKYDFKKMIYRHGAASAAAAGGCVANQSVAILLADLL